VLVLDCFKFVSYTLLGRASIKLLGLREHDSVLESIAYRAGKVTTPVYSVLQWEHAMVLVTQVLRPEILRI